MLIDWFTVIAQIINFLILLFLLNRFLYRPILKAIDKRQDQMQARWDSAEEANANAEAEAREHRQARHQLAEEREQILNAARAEAADIRNQDLQRARADVAQKRQEWLDAMENEQQSLMADLQQQFGYQVLEVVRRILRDLANVDLEQETIQMFQQKLHNLDDSTRQGIAAALGDRPVTVQTGTELSEASQHSLRQTLQDLNLVNGQAIHFAVSPDLLFGIRLQNDAYDLAWDAEDYLQDLEQIVSQSLPTSRTSNPKQPQHDH
jgi:F-type H+-transporting ATPase subunit b